MFKRAPLIMHNCTPNIVIIDCSITTVVYHLIVITMNFSYLVRIPVLAVKSRMSEFHAQLYRSDYYSKSVALIISVH